ncbi:hypothetical protein F5B22DRAFT_613497 [Xylaria bambusicola]|uniref:uncharacterized protein n=1 Tax=Xylaria bambusicola TaxID=326684 RepID=UPI002008650E|nr:uncharacterized protein F5B22DRAFT_613497 [Xylaria bambusicola]KAI0512858.1 hypothetical protein F5B22DRAFT_613497 [Xylaria bambusicola]
MVVVPTERVSPPTVPPEEYWRESLAGCEHTPYPSLPSFIECPQATQIVQYRLPNLERRSKGINTSTLIHAAWALIIGRMTDSEDVVFGSIAPEAGEPIPFRIRLQGGETVEQYLMAIQQQTVEAVSFASIGLARIAKLSSDCREACSFQSVLDVTAKSDHGGQLRKLEKYGLAIQLEVNGSQMDASASLDPRMIEPELVYKLLYRLGYFIQQLDSAKSEAELADVEMIPPLELSLIQEWNSVLPPVTEGRIHDVIKRNMLARPTAPAVCAWDGEMSYQELEDLSTSVAHRLIDAGLGPEKVVPLCFEKSKWTVVAMLSVLKAGGAFILLDASLPAARMQTICQKVNAEMCITSISCESQLSPFVRRTIVLCDKTAEYSASDSQVDLLHTATVGPRNAAYIIFTSGSTGEPKGCVVEHQSYCSAASGHGKILGMTSDTRALQFGSYNFAGAIMETLMTLMYGGCVCIPSDEDRTTALAQAICKLGANWAFLTSTVLALIHPEDVPTLRTICVGGEPIRNSQIKQWAPKVQLRQTYGSAETAAVVASAGLATSSTVSSVGKPTTARCWLTHPTDVNRLVPIGAPGEVVFEGPTIGREYIGNPEKSAQAFISAPAWRAALGTPAASARFYRTGDIAVYRSDGSLELQGRKDTQVKIRGQRVELGEIEHQARLASSELKEVAVDISVVDGSRPTLICFLVTTSDVGSEIKDTIQTVRTRLDSILPHYMVPSLFLPLPAFPHTISGKLDRKRLRELGSTMATQELQRSRAMAGKQLTQPSTEIERQLQEIWSKALKIEKSSIGVETSFFQLGGDSLTAMKVVAETRNSGMRLTMADIFRSDTIAGLAREQSLRAESIPAQPQGEVLDESSAISVLDQIDLKDTDLQRNDVEAIYPLTGVQDLLVTTTKATGILADYFVLDLDPELDITKLENGCKKAFQNFPVLRACWLRLEEKYWQVVLHQVDQPFRVVEASGNIAEFCQSFCLANMQSLLPTQPTAAWFLLKHETEGMKLILRMSHAQYDAFSMPLIFESVFDAYNGRKSPSQPNFPTYLSRISRLRSQSIEYWSQALKGSRLTRIVPHIAPSLGTVESTPSFVASQAEAHVPSRPKKITPATLVRAAWAILLSAVTSLKDITFGQVIAGRNADIPQIEKIVGCCLNIVPERVNLSSFTTVTDLLSGNQEELLKMGDADSLDSRDILKCCTDWPSEAAFDSILHHRDVDAEPEVQTPKGASHIKTLAIPLVPPFLFIVSVSKGTTMGLEVIGNTHLLTQETAQTLVDKLAYITEKLSAHPDMTIASLIDEVGSVV